MNLLLDTHVLLWWLNNDPILAEEARDYISDGQNPVFISAAVLWEIRIKQSIGKLEIPHDFLQVMYKQPFEFLPITIDHAYAVGDLPPIHRDPFDRLLIAQAKMENFTIITRDHLFEKYQVSTIRA